MPSSTHSVVSALVMGDAITVVARMAPASRCDCTTVGEHTYALRSPAPKHFENPLT